MLSLYEIGVQGIEITRILMEREGELTPELEARLDQIMREGPEAIEDAAMVVRSLEASAEACEEEVKRLAARAKSFQDNADRLKGYMTMALDTSFAGRVKTARFTVWTQKAPDSVAYDLREGFTLEQLRDENPDLVRVKLELNKQACKEANALPGMIYSEWNPGKRYARIK